MTNRIALIGKGVRSVVLTSKIILLICFVPLTAAAVPLSVGGFYAPGLVVGSAADDANIGLGGKARFSVGDGIGFTPRLTVGYSRLHYGLYGGALIAIYSRIENYTTFTVEVGVDYALDWGRLNPFIGGDLVFAVETPQLQYDETVFDFAPGICVGGGTRLRLSDTWAFEVAPRYSYMFDNPVRAAAGPDDLFRAGARTQLVEVALGFLYSF